VSNERKWSIFIRPAAGQTPRKVTKVIGLKGAGFSVLTPYHKARSGYLFKAPVDPKIKGRYTVPQGDIIGFSSDDRVKLSYHTDGFAQFSSENPGRIISGRDPATGAPKGLGLLARPLTSPAWSGASVGVTLWGIGDFKERSTGDEGLVFEPEDFYDRDCPPGAGSSYILSIYAFPKTSIAPIRYRNGEAIVSVSLEPLSGALSSVVELKIIDLPEEQVYLGLFVNRFMTKFNSPSGWALSGPGDFTAEKAGHALVAIYPRDVFPAKAEHSLNR
jgi:hypothetical protein